MYSTLSGSHAMKGCICGSTNSYETCCKPFLLGHRYPSTIEELIRSRYSAYVQNDLSYIQKTMRGKALQEFDPSNLKEIKWCQLVIQESSHQGNEGVGIFFVDYFYDGKPLRLKEKSFFRRIHNRWYYIDGLTQVEER